MDSTMFYGTLANTELTSIALVKQAFKAGMPLVVVSNRPTPGGEIILRIVTYITKSNGSYTNPHTFTEETLKGILRVHTNEAGIIDKIY
jgi:hypothetical protein